MYKEKLALYDELVRMCPEFERKGKTMPYTSANGHMFSFLNKNGDLGFRFSKDKQEKYIQEWNSDYLHSHGAVMKGYVLITDDMLEDLKKLKALLMESFKYVMSLDPK